MNKPVGKIKVNVYLTTKQYDRLCRYMEFCECYSTRLKWQQDLSRSAWPRQSSVGRLRRINMTSEDKIYFCSVFFVVLPLLYFAIHNYFVRKRSRGRKYTDLDMIVCYVYMIAFILFSFYFKYIANL